MKELIEKLKELGLDWEQREEVVDLIINLSIQELKELGNVDVIQNATEPSQFHSG